MIIETVIDISEFMKLLVLVILMFSSGIYLVEVNRLENQYDDSQPVFEPGTEFSLFFEAFIF